VIAATEPSKDVVFWGATGQAKVLRECVRASGWRVVAVFDNDRNLRQSAVDGVPLFIGKDGFARWRDGWGRAPLPRCLVAIGGDRGRDRLALQEFLEREGLSPLTAVHRTAFVADDATVGAGSQILAQSAVCAEAVLGRACIVNTGATVDHECRLGDGIHVCPGAHIAGCVEVGDHAMIGTGASVLPRISIGAGAIIGAGAVVISDVPSNVTVVGNPARITRGTVREHI
jgi:sugar O-acyltransferase (sialic acid O-acetyltransferase NeuD family)